MCAYTADVQPHTQIEIPLTPGTNRGKIAKVRDLYWPYLAGSPNHPGFTRDLASATSPSFYPRQAYKNGAALLL